MVFFGKSFENAARVFSSDDSGGGIEKDKQKEQETSLEEGESSLQKELERKEKAGLVRKDDEGRYETVVPKESMFHPDKQKPRKVKNLLKDND